MWNWNVLLNGNPAVDVFNGIKLGAGGELGIGVGEEEWGSGEREVLEGFIGRTDGLVDLIVSRFGDAPQGEPVVPPDSASTSGASDDHRVYKSEWQGAGQHPSASDGIIFSGIGAITRASIRDISSWMETLYKHGQNAYGVRDNASAAHPRKRKRQSSSKNFPGLKSKTLLNQGSSEANNKTTQPSSSLTGIPRPIVEPSRASPSIANKPSSPRKVAGQRERDSSPSSTQTTAQTPPSGTETLMKYLTLGVYGSKWATFPRATPVHQRMSDLRDEDGGVGAGSGHGKKNSTFLGEQWRSHGYFMIGFQGELDQDNIFEDDEQDMKNGTDPGSVLGNQSWTSQTMLRTFQVERTSQTVAGSSSILATSGRLI